MPHILGVGRTFNGDRMDRGLELLLFAVVLAAGTGVVWLRLATLILQGRWPRPYGSISPLNDDPPPGPRAKD